VSVLVIASLAALTCLDGSASAAEVHVYSHSFGEGELALTPQSGIAVNEGTGAVYVSDTNHSRIAQFTASGTAGAALTGISTPTFIAVDNSTGPSKGDIYVVEGQTTVTKLDPTGAPVSSWGTAGHLGFTEEVTGVAVDPAGNLWVGTRVLGHENPGFGFEGAAVSGREFDQAGTTIRSWTNAFPVSFSRAASAGIAVDSFDNLYALLTQQANGETQIGGVGQISPTGEFLATLNERWSGIASDPANANLYLGSLNSESPLLYRYTLGFTGAGATEPLERFGGQFEGPVPAGAAVKDGLEAIAAIAAPADGRVYVLDPGVKKPGKVALFDLEEVEPPSATIEPPDSVTQTSAHVVGRIDPNAPTGSWPSHDVAWEFKCTPECPGNGGYIEVEVDGSEQTVEGSIVGLEPGTEYSVVLVARNRGGEAEAPENPHPEDPNPGEKFKTAPAKPSVIDSAASEVFRGEAILNASVNSNGAATTYHFEYMTKVAFEAEGFEGDRTNRTPESEPLPSPATPRPVSARVAGLEPATEYVYRAVAHNSLGTESGATVTFRSQVGVNLLEAGCPNQALRTDAGARLPDCRAYELVTPVEKNGSLVESYGAGLQAATNGSGTTWFTGQTATGIPSPQGAHQGYAFYLSTLVGESWSSQRLLAPQQFGAVSALVGLTGDERYALIETAVEKAHFEPGLYLLDIADQTYTPIVPPQVGREVGPRVFALDGASADDSLIFFESHLSLTSNAAAGKNNLYVWNRDTDALSLAGALPGTKGEAPAGGSFGGAYSWWGPHQNPDSGGAEEALYVEAVHAISESGDAIYFTAAVSDQLYSRHGLIGTKPTSVRVSVANPGVTDPHGEKPAAFQEATPDGSKAFFLSSGRLTADANTGPTDESNDLYRYDAASKPPLVDVTPEPAGTGAQVQGLLGIAEDGRSGYLVAKGTLTPSGGVEGDSNIYHFEEEQGGQFAYRFVADLGLTLNGPTERNWSPTANSPKTARVSKDGGTVLFMSQRSLTGLPEGACIVGNCMQVYRYSMAEGTVACLSCNPTGEGSPLFGAELTAEAEGTLVPENHIRAKYGIAVSGILPANLSSSGTRVFFQTPESLLPEDVNGSDPRKNCANPSACIDAYEWEAVGTGSCHTPNQADGCLYLISTGESRRSSYFINASADGSSAFIITNSPLVSVDQDELTDVYDARVDGGIASQHALAPESCNTSGSCKGPSSTPPPAASAGTSSFQGSGNPSLKQCKKGSVRKQGKCVKKMRKHHKKKHHKKKHHKKKHRTTGKKRSGGAK
jgi:hypothetical protein